jgi:hypothetical protein
MLKNVNKMLKFYPSETKNKRISFCKKQTSNFILHKRKLKLAIKVETTNIF